MGSKAPFSLQPDLPQIPDPPRRAKPVLRMVERPAPAPPRPPPPDRSALDAAQKALTAINARRLEEEDELRRRRAALEAEELAARQAWSKARRSAEAALEAARRAYRAAGGDA